MRIHRNLLIAAASAIAAVGAIVSTSVLTASAAPRAAATEHFQIVGVGNAPEDVILWGTVTGHAIDNQNSSNTVSVLKFANGTITIKQAPKSVSQTFNPKTCFGTIVESGNYKVTKGTGVYKGASGSGKFQTTVLIIAGKSHGTCSLRNQPVAIHVVVNANGSLRR